MADIKITDLTAYTDPVSTDVLPIVDVSNDLTKKVSIADLLENAGTGSATAPSFSFDGDNNTGVYRPGADQLALTAGGTQALLANNTGITIPGNVGIGGITTPSHLLHIGGSTNSLGNTAGNELLNLRIQSDTQNTDSLDFTARRVSAGTDWTSAAQRIQRKVDATLMGYIQLGSQSSDLITFGRNNNEYARLDGSGRFGIGTSNPSEKLHVEGNLNLNGSVLGGIFTAAVSDDNYVQVATPFKGGMLVITPFTSYDAFPQPIGAGLMYFDVGNTRLLSVMVDTDAVRTGGSAKLISGGLSTSTTATDFTDGAVTITTPATSTFRIFNRCGYTQRFKLVFM